MTMKYGCHCDDNVLNMFYPIKSDYSSFSLISDDIPVDGTGCNYLFQFTYSYCPCVIIYTTILILSFWLSILSSIK